MWLSVNLCQVVKKENSTNKPKSNHCNVLLPFNAFQSTLEKEPSKPKKPVPVAQDENTMARKLTVLRRKLMNS